MQSTLFETRQQAAPLELRPYQGATIKAIYDFLRARTDNPLAVIPTAGGKTPIIATICRDTVEAWHGRALVIQPSKELIEQTADELAACFPSVPVGVYSAGVGRRETDEPVIVAGIHSIYDKAWRLGRFDLILPDEAHLIPPDGEGMYQRFFGDARQINPNVRVAGFTATPFRLSSGPICRPDGILNNICYEVGVRELIVGGYISPLRTPSVETRIDISGVHIRGGEYVAGELEDAFDCDETVRAACAEIIAHSAERQSVLIFTAGIKHGKHVAKVIEELSGQRCAFVSGETPDGEREASLAAFKAGSLKYLSNVNILTTGYNCRRVDCVVLLRSTLSPGLYYQIVGRGFRLSPETDKRDCLVLDFGGNIERHGPVDMLKIPGDKSAREDSAAPTKTCPQCREIVGAAYARCPQCGFEFPPPERSTHDTRAANRAILSTDVRTEQLDVLDTVYSVHVGKSQIPLMRVDYYYCSGRFDCVTDWICLEHEGYAREKAVGWWRQRSPDAVPITAESAVAQANLGALAETKSVTIKIVPGKKFPEIVEYDIGEMPEPISPADNAPAESDGDKFSYSPPREAFIADEDIPF